MNESRDIAEGLWHEAIVGRGLNAAKLRRFDAVRALTDGVGAQWRAPRLRRAPWQGGGQALCDVANAV